MARFVSPFERVTDSDNKPIVGAKLFFYETGTKTLKTIYLDFENQIPAENPVISLAGGINPDRYINGIYNIVQTDNTGAVGVEGALIWERDPVGDLETGPFADWNSTSFYSFNDVVKGSDLVYYISTVAGINTNQGNDPISSPSEWDDAGLVFADNTQTLTNKTLGTGYGGSVLILDTAQATTSGSTIDFTSIPSWVKRITVSYVGVSTTAITQDHWILIGDAGGLEATGYLSAAYKFNSTPTIASFNVTAEFLVAGAAIQTAATGTLHGSVVLSLHEASSFTWVISGGIQESTGQFHTCAGSKALTATLDRLQVGTDGTYDAGAVNILYEG